MSSTKAKTTTKAAVAAPQTREEAESWLGEMGRLQRAVADTELRMNEQLARIKASYEERAKPMNDQIHALFEGVSAWAEAHRAELLERGSETAKGEKTVRLTTGEVSWRMSPPSVTVRAPEMVIEALKKLGLGRFIRTKEEVNKEALLADRLAWEGVVKGLSLTQREQFVAKPFESDIEHASTVKSVGRAA